MFKLESNGAHYIGIILIKSDGGGNVCALGNIVGEAKCPKCRK